jgi:hypothetical protein
MDHGGEALILFVSAHRDTFELFEFAKKSFRSGGFGA